MHKKVLVMGGSYFIGKKIVNVLIENNYDVYILNRGTKKAHDIRIHQIIADRNDSAQMKSVLKGLSPDTVIDVSGLNKSQSQILCEALVGKQVETFVYISSSAVYDVEHLTAPYRETDKLGENRFWTEYGTNKIEAERYYTEHFSEMDTDLVILRPPYVYGENNYAQRESFIFNHSCANKPILIPKSNPMLQFIYADDLANTLIYLLKHPIEKTSVFNIGNEKPLTAKDWVDRCAEAASRTAQVIFYDYQKDGRTVRDFFPFYDYDNFLDVTKIHSICSFETPLEIGLSASFDWYLENRGIIQFKEAVSQNEADILKRLGIPYEN